MEKSRIRDKHPGSAIPLVHCVLQDVFVSAFDGLFKEQRSAGENWLAVEPHRVPSPRPGENVNSSVFLSSSVFPEEKQEPV
jgi:hypothetical protein